MKGQMIGGFGNLLKQAQKLQAKIAKVQEEMATKTVEGSAGGGMVVATVNGNSEVVSIKIEPEVINPEDAEMLQDLVVAAVNQAMKKAKNMLEEEMGKLTAGLNIPGLF